MRPLTKYGRWKRSSRALQARYWLLRSLPLDVRVFGAVPDSEEDQAPAIQDAIDHLNKFDGGFPSFPPGNYKLAHRIKF